jgi:hypothetical protein
MNNNSKIPSLLNVLDFLNFPKIPNIENEYFISQTDSINSKEFVIPKDIVQKDKQLQNSL